MGQEEASALCREPQLRHSTQGRDHGQSLPRADDRTKFDRRAGASDGVTGGVERAIRYFHAIREYLKERTSPHQAIVAFSGEHEFGSVKVTEASPNGFASNKIADKLEEDSYRFLVCANKFQTGYDKPLLHTVYVDKPLAGIKAVQILSRLYRARPQKHAVFALEFQNDIETIRNSFAPWSSGRADAWVLSTMPTRRASSTRHLRLLR
jgi:type I site-specific restriction-modification system R (restriction) subunit